jgi:hypothetical protein
VAAHLEGGPGHLQPRWRLQGGVVRTSGQRGAGTHPQTRRPLPIFLGIGSRE